MSAGTESASNGFTAVNDGATAQNLAVKALNHKDWSSTNGDAGAADYPAQAGSSTKKQSHDVESTTSDGNAANEQLAAAAASVAQANDSMDVDGHQTTAQNPAAATNGSTYMDDDHMAHLLQQTDRPDADAPNNATNDQSFADSKSSMGEASPIHAASAAAAAVAATTPGDAPIITNAGLQVDMKKRKRAFANRTKTGCATCRKRKKKCDEGKPACGNCVRGGFTCLGYSQKKDVGSRMGSTQRATITAIAPANRYWDASNSRPTRGPSFDEGVNGMPPAQQDNRVPAMQETRPLPSWSGSTYPASRAVSERPAQALPPPPTFHEQRELPTDPRRPSWDSRFSLVQRTCDEFMPPYPKRPESLENESSRSQKENKYQPRESVLKKDRDNCRALCAKLNTAIVEGSGPDEILRRLQSIVQPGSRGTSPPSSPLRSGEVGRDVVVEAPFRADYGYNLHIGDEVVIEGGCVIKDPTSIRIGNRTRIGANVLISGEYMMHEAKWQTWSRKVPIRIGQDCIIGPGCIIAASDKAELVIGDGVYIAAGNVITQDVTTGSHIGAPTTNEQRFAWRPM